MGRFVKTHRPPRAYFYRSSSYPTMAADKPSCDDCGTFYWGRAWPSPMELVNQQDVSTTRASDGRGGGQRRVGLTRHSGWWSRGTSCRVNKRRGRLRVCVDTHINIAQREFVCGNKGFPRFCPPAPVYIFWKPEKKSKFHLVAAQKEKESNWEKSLMPLAMKLLLTFLLNVYR